MKLSVIMPVYNCESYVTEAIESIISQSFEKFEFIIINDGSIDETTNICRYFASIDRRINLIEQKNQGLIRSLNNALDAASGEYIVRMDADDISHPDRLKKQVEFMDSNPSLVASGCYYNLIGEANGIVKVPTNPESCRSLLKASSCIAHPTAIIRNVKINNGQSIRYDEHYQHVEDYHLWFCLSQVGDISNLNEVLLDYRVHRSQITQKFNREMIKNQMKVVDLNNSKEKEIILSILHMKIEFKWISFVSNILRLIVSLEDKEVSLKYYLIRILLSSLKKKVTRN